MTVNVKGFAPYQNCQVGSGTSYTADSTGTITGVPVGPDLRDLQNDGGYIIDSTALPSANGMFVTRLPLTTGKNTDGTTLASSPASGKFGLTLSAGTSEILVSENAVSNSKTDAVVFEHQLPRNYIAGQNLTLIANAQYTLGSGTVSAHTVAVAAYKCADAGTQGSDIDATSAVTTSTSAADASFTITGTTLNPLDRIMLKLTSVIADTGGATITQQVNSVRLT